MQSSDQTGIQEWAADMAAQLQAGPEPSYDDTDGRSGACTGEIRSWIWNGASAGSAEAPYTTIEPGIRAGAPVWVGATESGDLLGTWPAATHTAAEALAEAEAEEARE